MSMLCDSEIICLCGHGGVVTPFDASLVQPCSLDIRLADTYAEYFPDRNKDGGLWIDIKDQSTYHSQIREMPESGYILFPGRFILCSTVERFDIPRDIAVKVCGRSSIGRLGIFVENAGLVDPGFSGEITLEIYNANSLPVILYPGMSIAQAEFHKITPCRQDYKEKGGRYTDQTGPTISRYWSK